MDRITQQNTAEKKLEIVCPKVDRFRSKISKGTEDIFRPEPNAAENEKVSIINVPGKGLGVFANEQINNGERIATFKGNIYEAERISNLPSYVKDHAIQISETEYLLDESGLANYVNHSCKPNCGIRNLTEITAMRDIKPGEEISWDYEMTEDSDWEMENCKCGTDNCRGSIKAYRYMPIETKKKYEKMGMISEWLIEKYGSNLKPQIIEGFKGNKYRIEGYIGNEMPDCVLREISDTYRLVFSNGPYCAYLLYPSQIPATAVSAYEVMPNLRGDEFIDMNDLMSLDLKKIKHSETGENPILYMDPEKTYEILKKRISQESYFSLLRENISNNIVGMVFAYKGTLEEIYKLEEWRNPIIFSGVEDENHFSDDENFFEQMNKQAGLNPEDTIFSWGATCTTPGIRGFGPLLAMKRIFFRLMPKENHNLQILSEMAGQGTAYKIFRRMGTEILGSIITNHPIISATIGEYNSIFNLPINEFIALQKKYRNLERLGYTPKKGDNPKVKFDNEKQGTVVAVDNINAGEIIGSFNGVTYKAKDRQCLPIHPFNVRGLAIKKQDGEYLYAKDSLAQQINHSDTPNSYINDQYQVVSKTNIPKGEEITRNYNIHN